VGQDRERNAISNERAPLRIVQIVCLLLAVSACWLVAHSGKPRNNGKLGPIQWAIILAAMYCAVSGFTIQRTITKGPTRSKAARGDSTQYSRWRAGQFVRLFFPVSVAGWGDVLIISGGPTWMAYVLCGLGILLVLAWSPGTAPFPKP
jgi:hypothetical protein